MMYENNPKMLSSDAVALFTDASSHHKLVELFGESCVPAAATAKSVEPSKITRREKKFSEGDEMQVAHSPAFNRTSKSAAFESNFYGPCRVTEADHPRYDLFSYTGLVKRQRIHSQRLARY